MRWFLANTVIQSRLFLGSAGRAHFGNLVQRMCCTNVRDEDRMPEHRHPGSTGASDPASEDGPSPAEQGLTSPPRRARGLRAVRDAIRSRFFLKVAVRLWLVFFTLAVCLLLFFNQFWRRFIQENVQVAHWNLAGNVARDAAPLVTDTVDYGELLHTFYRYFRLFPGFDFYLVDDEGRIITYYTNGRPLRSHMLNLEPIRRFIDPYEGASLPVIGDNPAHGHAPRSIFSAAPLRGVNGASWFIYVVLRNWESSTQEDIATKSLVVRSGFAGFLSVLVAMFVLGVLLLAALTKRLTSMQRTVSAFERGQLDKRISDDSTDEVGQMARAFNSMAGSVQDLIGKLTESDRKRRELIANVSHDLRTPLTSAIGNIELLGNRVSDSADSSLKESAARSLKTLEYLSGLVDELFELAKLEARDRAPEMRPVPVESLVELVAMKYEPIAQEESVTVTTAVTAPGASVLSDPQMLERLLSNLVENAIRYNREGGHVVVSASRSGDRVRFEVRDTGIGIPTAEIPFIFDRLYRVRSSQPGKDGSGLGLAIVKRLSEVLGCRIDVESVEGQSTTFSFDLPAAAQ